MIPQLEHLWTPVHESLMPLSSYVAKQLGLSEFAPHGPTFFAWFACFTVTQPLAPYVSRLLVPKVYNRLSRYHRYSWTVHCVSMLHAMVVVPWAVYLSLQDIPAVQNDRAFGWDDRIGSIVAVASAYFVWDTVETILSGSGIDFTIHGAASSFIYLTGYKPFVAYYGPRALCWELSTPFLNIHWFMDKANMTGSIWQLINGVILMSTFFGARLVYGTYMSYAYQKTLWAVRHEVPVPIYLFYSVGNAILVCLNFLWFTKMVTALSKRFPKEEAGKRSGGMEDSMIILDGQALKLPSGQKIKAVVTSNGYSNGKTK